MMKSSSFMDVRLATSPQLAFSTRSTGWCSRCRGSAPSRPCPLLRWPRESRAAILSKLRLTQKTSPRQCIAGFGLLENGALWSDLRTIDFETFVNIFDMHLRCPCKPLPCLRTHSHKSAKYMPPKHCHFTTHNFEETSEGSFSAVSRQFFKYMLNESF